LDLDEVAVKAARENVELNRVSDRVEVFHGNLLDSVSAPADIVVGNLLAEIILSFTDDAFSIVKPGGKYITSGIIGFKKDEVKEALEKSGFTIDEVLMMEDWVAIIASRP
ncbi:50S ribosomal protein L11 methyltransferase, partial [Butyricicoccus sp. 1XD8-22]